MPRQTLSVLSDRMAKEMSDAQPDLFGRDPTVRLELKRKLGRQTQWLRDLRASHAEGADEMLTLTRLAANRCFAAGDLDGMNKHAALYLQYTLPRQNAAVLTMAQTPGGAMMVQWAEQPAEQPAPVDDGRTINAAD